MILFRERDEVLAELDRLNKRIDELQNQKPEADDPPTFYEDLSRRLFRLETAKDALSWVVGVRRTSIAMPLDWPLPKEASSE